MFIDGPDVNTGTSCCRPISVNKRSTNIWVLPIYRYRPKWPILSAFVVFDKMLLYPSCIQTTCARKHNEARQQLSYNNASKCVFINKQTRLTMKHASAVVVETQALPVSFAMLDVYCPDQAAACRCCVWINSHCTSRSFHSTESLTVRYESPTKIYSEKLVWKMNCVMLSNICFVMNMITNAIATH